MELINSCYYRKGDLWLTRDHYRCWTWQECDALRNLDIVNVEPVESMEDEGFIEIHDGVYMLEDEEANVPAEDDEKNILNATAPEVFTPASDGDDPFVRSVHTAVADWPSWIPHDTPGRRLWATINDLESRYKGPA